MLQFYHLDHFPVTWKAWCGLGQTFQWFQLCAWLQGIHLTLLDAGEDSWTLMQTPPPSTPFSALCLSLKLPQLQDLLSVPAEHSGASGLAVPLSELSIILCPSGSLH